MRTYNGPDTGPVQSASGISGLKMDIHGSYRSGNISSRYFAIGVKNVNLAGWSGFGVLVVRFSPKGAVKKHVPLIFREYIKAEY